MKNNKILVICLLFIILSIFSFSQPKRIISLVPSITENLYYLGVEDRIVGVTSYCLNPPEAQKKVIVGSLLNLNIEKIYSLSPDLILGINVVNRRQTLDNLIKLGMNVVLSEDSENYYTVLKNFLNLGERVGSYTRACEIVRQVDLAVNYISHKARSFPKVTVFWQVGVSPLFTAGKNSFADELIKMSGGLNIFSEIPIKYPSISREDVLKKDPEVIILVTMGDVSNKEKLYWQKFKDLKAVKSNKIFIVDSDKVCQPNPLNFIVSLIQITRFLHPEIFKSEK